MRRRFNLDLSKLAPPDPVRDKYFLGYKSHSIGAFDRLPPRIRLRVDTSINPAKMLELARNMIEEGNSHETVLAWIEEYDKPTNRY